jgi:hypothetical protein
MRKLAFIFIASAFISCNKETEDDLSGGGSGGSNNQPTEFYTVEVSYSEFVYQLHSCVFTYTDSNGVVHENESNMDRTITNVDLTKPFEVRASAGVYMYPVGQPAQFYAQNCNWQLKKDGLVIDARPATNYVYSMNQ